jgi:hypothetical protein
MTQLFNGGIRLEQFCDPNGNMLHKTRYALQNFVAKAERFGYVVDWPHGLYVRTAIRLLCYDADFGRAATAVHNWAHRPGWRVPWNYPARMAHKLQRDLTTSELETATGLLDENWDEDDFQLDKLIDAAQAIHLSPVSPVSSAERPVILGNS